MECGDTRPARVARAENLPRRSAYACRPHRRLERRATAKPTAGDDKGVAGDTEARTGSRLIDLARIHVLAGRVASVPQGTWIPGYPLAIPV